MFLFIFVIIFVQSSFEEFQINFFIKIKFHKFFMFHDQEKKTFSLLHFEHRNISDYYQIMMPFVNFGYFYENVCDFQITEKS